MTRSDTYDRFAESAGEYGVELTRTTAESLPGTIESVITTPVVGAPLPWDDCSLPEPVPTDPSPAELDAAVTGVSAASLAVADYGSVVLEATPGGGEPVSLFPDEHVVVLREDDIVPDMETAFEWLDEQFRDTGGSAIVATGPSATADMGSLVKGAHGPKEVHAVVVT
ncbi:LUD domain-containing protein [Halobaculum rubrum]|nr:LUD domain-containing protein [Halobaculum rubrum]